MPRKPDPNRKPELLAQIIDHLLDKPLASLSMRTLAEGLGLSTYSLVYHFGDRGGLVREIVLAIASRQEQMLREVEIDTSALDVYLDGFRESWRWTLTPRNRQLQRLEFEAAMLEVLAPEEFGTVRGAFAVWHRIGRQALMSLGVDEERAEIEARIMVDLMYGLQFDLVLTGDVERVDRVFQHALDGYRRRIEELVAEPQRRRA